MTGFEWDNVRLLLALLRAANVERAAAALGVDRSTISRRLAALERDLGARLFARTRDGLEPLPAALRLRPIAERMEADATSLVSVAAADEQRVEGAVRVATTEAFAALLVADGLLALNDQHPGLVIELLGGNRPVDIARGEADLALRLTPVREPSLQVRCIARTPIGLFAAPSYLQARGAVASRAALRGHDILMPSGELARLPESRWLAARKGVRVVFRSNSMPALVAAAVAGRGVVPLGLTWGQGRPELRTLFVIDEIPKRPIFLVTRAEAARRPAVRATSERIVAILARAAAPAR